MNREKMINGKRFYWYGWTSEESSAIGAKENLESKGKLVILQKGDDKWSDNKNGWNIWYRPS